LQGFLVLIAKRFQLVLGFLKVQKLAVLLVQALLKLNECLLRGGEQSEVLSFELNSLADGLLLLFGFDRLLVLAGHFHILDPLGDHLHALEARNLVNVVLHVDLKLEFVVLLIRVFVLSLTDFITCNLEGESWRNGSLVIVFEQHVHVAILVVECDTFSQREHGLLCENLVFSH